MKLIDHIIDLADVHYDLVNREMSTCVCSNETWLTLVKELGAASFSSTIDYRGIRFVLGDMPTGFKLT